MNWKSKQGSQIIVMINFFSLLFAYKIEELTQQ